MSITAFRLAAIRKEGTALWHLAWPVLVGQLATVGMGVADVVMTGHTSAEDLATVSLGTSIWMTVMVTVSGIMMAINAVVAHEVGSGDLTRLPHLIRQSLWKGLSVGLIACLLTNMAALLFDCLQLTPAVHEKATLFLHVISIGLPPFAIYRALYGYNTSLNQTKPIMLIALSGLVFNTMLNWLLIYGHWGLPKLGAVGCAVSTAAGMWLMLGAMLWWVNHAPAYQKSNPFSQWERPHWPEIFSLLKMGLPIGVTYFAEVSAFSVVGLLVARFGIIAMSAHQIALNFASLMFMVPLSLGIGLITRVGQALGEGDPTRARFTAWVGVGMALTFGCMSAIFICLFRQAIAATYSSDPAVQEMTIRLLLLAALFQLSDATQVAAACAIRGYKITRPPMLIHLVAFWGFSLPLGCLLGLGLVPGWLPWAPFTPMATTGFWVGLVLGLTIAALLLLRLLAQLSKQRIVAAQA